MPADDDTYWRVELHGVIVRLIRTPEPYTSAEQARDCHVQLLHRVLALGLDRARCGQLVDLRDAPLRTDPTFEEAIRDICAIVHRRGGLVGSLYPGVGQADVELSAGAVRGWQSFGPGAQE